MDKSMINYSVNVLLLIAFGLAGLTGVFKFLTVNGLVPHVKFMPFFLINTVHDWSGVIMTLLVLVHIVLNWNFMAAMTKKLFRRGEK